MRGSPFIDPQADSSVGWDEEDVEKIFKSWPKEVHDTLSKHGICAHVARYKDGHATVRLFKGRGKYLMSAVEINPARYDLPRLWLLGDLDALLTLWGASMDTALDAAEATARERGLEP